MDDNRKHWFMQPPETGLKSTTSYSCPIADEIELAITGKSSNGLSLFFCVQLLFEFVEKIQAPFLEQVEYIFKS